jgi:divalent metal cation (Fe/Co/Zn/Cd) transporter
VLAELLVIGAAIVLMAACALRREIAETRRQVRRADWLLTRADAAISEARRASVTVGGLQLVDHLLGVVARDGEPDPDAAG